MPKINFFRLSKKIFEESLKTLMPELILAVENRFFRKGIELQIQIVADVSGRLEHADEKGFSLLVTNFRPRGSEIEKDHISATIIVNKNANRNLAKYCVAYEMYFLLVELDLFAMGGHKLWPVSVARNKHMDEAISFARDVLIYSDLISRDAVLTETLDFFPTNSLMMPLRKKRDGYEMPPGLDLDSQNPFYAKLNLYF